MCYIIFNKIRRDPYEKGSILASGCCSAFSLATPVFAGKAESTEPAQNTENALTEPFDLAQEGNFDPEEFPYAQDNVLVKLSPDSGDAVTPVLAQCGVARLEHLFDTDEGRWFTAHLESGVLPPQALEALRQLDQVVTAEYNYIYQTEGQYEETQLDSAVNEQFKLFQNPRIESQWNLLNCGVQQSWAWLLAHGENPGGKSDVVVAVIDTGVDYTHEDLRDNMWVNEKEIPGNGIDDDGNGYVDDVYGVDIVAGRGSGSDDHGHGTHVAGVIAADNNFKGIIGVAFNTRIMSVKAGMSSGYFHQDAIAKAILYAYNNGADVINMSFGGSACSIAVQDALAKAYTRCVLVASAGNDGMPNEGLISLPNYPAALPYVLGVMSVDRSGVESSFTNYDSIAYNNVEYELYAPGENIVSTIPGDRYATWSGTSMAAPLVSGMAALLRGYYSDPGKYPTKFIYGQLAATSEKHAQCYDPKLHGLHNLPAIVNLYEAFTRLPQPEIRLSDYMVFDLSKYSEANNGDGVIDAGETVALGFTLRNRWGMSRDTLVTVDTYSEAGLPCNYVQFSADGEIWGESAVMNYGSVGTYSTQDCGKIQDGEFILDWEHPFLMRVTKDCPNDYILKVNVRISAKNGLNEKDDADYTSVSAITLDVRRGVILPDVIDHDMTLTRENYYIIPNATEIKPGVTVTVEAGTQIQFWSDDPHDAYADTAITYLNVRGTLLCEGTEEDHVRLFPSELMSAYRVQIYESGDGYVSLRYTDVVNGYFSSDDNPSRSYPGISSAYGCEFRRNFNDKRVLYRCLSGGKVETGSDAVVLNISKAESCAFYKMGISSDSSWADFNYGNYKGCIFVDSRMYLKGSYTDCVFYGNYSRATDGTTAVSSYTAKKADSTLSVTQVHYDPNTGTTRVRVEGVPFLRRFAESLGGALSDSIPGKYVRYYDIILPCAEITDILVDQDELTLDTGMTYGLQPTVQPSETASALQLCYESLDPDVAQVSAEGRIQPLAQGDAIIRISSPDGSVWRDVTVHVVDLVDITAIVPTQTALRMNVGTRQRLTYKLEPVNTTRTGIAFSSDDEDVVTVDSRGMLTAVAPGTATVTVASETAPEVFAQVEVEVVRPVEDIRFAENIYFTALGAEEDDLGLIIEPANATDQAVIWESSNPEVCYVDETGTLIKEKTGSATLRATAHGTEIYDEITVCVTEGESRPRVVDIFQRHSVYYCILDDGSLWRWGDKLIVPEQLPVEDVSDITVNNSYSEFLVLHPNGTVDSYANSGAIQEEAVLTDVADITGSYSNGYYYALKFDGTVWTWKLAGKPQQILGVFQVSQIVPSDFTVAMLTQSGDVYLAGYGHDPKLVCSDAVGLQENSPNSYGYYTVELEDSYAVYSEAGLQKTVKKRAEPLRVNYYRSFYVKDGSVYGSGYNGYGSLGVGMTDNSVSEYTALPGIENAESIFMFDYNTFVQTADGKLYGMGSNSSRQLADLSTEDRYTPVRVLLGLQPNEEPFALTDTNVGAGDVLTEQELVLDFNEYLIRGSNFRSITLRDGDGNSVSLGKAELRLDKLTVTAALGFEEGVEYTLTIPQNALVTKFGDGNDATTVTFTFSAQEELPLTYAAQSLLLQTQSTLPSGAVTDDDAVAARTWTEEKILARWDDFCAQGYNTTFWHNAILNRFTETNVEKWLRIQAPDGSSDTVIGLGGNYWGTDGMSESAKEAAIDKQIIDNRDFKTLARINEGTILETTPEDVWPCVAGVSLSDKSGKNVSVVGNEEVTFTVRFNRDMDMDIPLEVRFGSAYPYADYEVPGAYTDARTWQGTTTLRTIIENGYQFWSIGNGRSAAAEDGSHLKLYQDWGRFSFRIDTSSAQAMIMQGHAEADGVHLTWTQDDYGTLAGYNVYRADSENGATRKLNSSVILPEEDPTAEGRTLGSFVDSDVEGGTRYYYSFTVVPTDVGAEESKASGRTSVVAMDIEAPQIVHTPVLSAVTGKKLEISALVTDNVAVTGVTLHYRTVGAASWNALDMASSNDKYFAYLPADVVTLAGLEYYIAATDGVSTTYAGGRDETRPYVITVQQSADADSLGDLDGDGLITLKDALQMLRISVGLDTPTAEQITRGDINGNGEIDIADVLRVVQYVNGDIPSVRDVPKA